MTDRFTLHYTRYSRLEVEPFATLEEAVETGEEYSAMCYAAVHGAAIHHHDGTVTRVPLHSERWDQAARATARYTRRDEIHGPPRPEWVVAVVDPFENQPAEYVATSEVQARRFVDAYGLAAGSVSLRYHYHDGREYRPVANRSTPQPTTIVRLERAE